MKRPEVPEEFRFDVLDTLVRVGGPVSPAELMHEIQNRTGANLERDFPELMQMMEESGDIIVERVRRPVWMGPVRQRMVSVDATPKGRNWIEPAVV